MLNINVTFADLSSPIQQKNWLTEKDPDAGKDWRWEEKGMTDDELVGWHHWLDGQVWASSRSWWWTGRADVLQSMGSQSQTWLSDWTELLSNTSFPSSAVCFQLSHAGHLPASLHRLTHAGHSLLPALGSGCCWKDRGTKSSGTPRGLWRQPLTTSSVAPRAHRSHTPLLLLLCSLFNPPHLSNTF